MQYGFNLPISGALAAPDAMARIAREGEALGYDYLTVTDHVVLPDLAEPGYPYSESGAFYSHDTPYRHEQLTCAAWLAAMTTRLRLVLAVMVVPHRPAVLAAKQLATIDVLSRGRLVVGIGAGWLKSEFDAVVTTPFAERGAVTDEYVAAFRTLWTEDKPKIAGKYVRFDGLVLDPKPVQRPHPQIWVGGESGPSLRRAAGCRRRRAAPVLGRRGGADRRHPRAAGPRRRRHRLRFRAADGSRRHRRDAPLPRARAGAGLTWPPIASAATTSPPTGRWSASRATRRCGATSPSCSTPPAVPPRPPSPGASPTRVEALAMLQSRQPSCLAIERSRCPSWKSIARLSLNCAGATTSPPAVALWLGPEGHRPARERCRFTGRIPPRGASQLLHPRPDRA